MQSKSLSLLATALVVFTAAARAHEGDHAANDDSYDNQSQVTIKTDADKRLIDANGLPDHKPGAFPNRGNPNEISPQHYHFEMPLKPHAAAEPIPVRRYLFGVALNGVVFDPGTAEVWKPGDKIVSRPGPGTRMQPGLDRSRIWNYEGMGRMNLGIDSSHAHVQPTGAYHYHGLPTGLIERLRKNETKPQMLLIGYAADGYPIYAEYGHETAADANSLLKKLRSSYQLKKGRRPTGDDGPGGMYDGTFVQDYEFTEGSGDLDQANGREGVTPEYPAGTYYYVVTDAFPFIPRYFHGEPDRSFEKQLGPPPGGRDGPPSGPRGPRGRRPLR
ncbi:MAG: YHYH protein [Pirellulales bacterium]